MLHAQTTKMMFCSYHFVGGFIVTSLDSHPNTGHQEYNASIGGRMNSDATPQSLLNAGLSIYLWKHKLGV